MDTNAYASLCPLVKTTVNAEKPKHVFVEMYTTVVIGELVLAFPAENDVCKSGVWGKGL